MSMHTGFPDSSAQTFGASALFQGQCSSDGSHCLYRLKRKHKPLCLELGDIVRNKGSPYSIRAPKSACPMSKRICCVPAIFDDRNDKFVASFFSPGDRPMAYRSLETSGLMLDT